MPLTKIYANLSCSDLADSTAWFGKIFARSPDARPMAGLAEWHHESSSGFQLYQDPDKAGNGTMTLIVEDLKSPGWARKAWLLARLKRPIIPASSALKIQTATLSFLHSQKVDV